MQTLEFWLLIELLRIYAAWLHCGWRHKIRKTRRAVYDQIKIGGYQISWKWQNTNKTKKICLQQFFMITEFCYEFERYSGFHVRQSLSSS